MGDSQGDDAGEKDAYYQTKLSLLIVKNDKTETQRRNQHSNADFRPRRPMARRYVATATTAGAGAHLKQELRAKSNE